MKKDISAEKKTRRPVRRRTYHHGELQEALLGAAERVLLREGLGGLTLRACAREAGVSHAAPAHHFSGLAGLLGALAAHGFGRLSRLVDAASRDAGSDPQVALPAIGVAYVDFALRHPDLYRLMFRSDALPARDFGLSEAVRHCRESVGRAAEAALRADSRRIVGMDRAAEFRILVWGLLHGYATLALGQCIPEHTLSREETLRLAGQLLIRLQPMLAGPEYGSPDA
ncbi:MAG: TetR/AcrR family transcriptional regulator [Pseudomonadota bacterium]